MLRLTFEMAVDDAMIRKNPSKFKIADFLLGDAAECTALTKFQQEIYLEFIRKNGQDSYYDNLVILLEPGLRISKLYRPTQKTLTSKSGISLLSINYAGQRRTPAL